MFDVIYDVYRRTDIILFLDLVFVLPGQTKSTVASRSKWNARAMWHPVTVVIYTPAV